jgi:hypothetical protein
MQSPLVAGVRKPQDANASQAATRGAALDVSQAPKEHEAPLGTPLSADSRHQCDNDIS